MAAAMQVAAAFMLATALVQASQCSGGSECPSDNEPGNGVSLLQINLQANALEEQHMKLGSALSLFERQWQPVVSASQLPHVLHVTTQWKTSFGGRPSFPERASWVSHNPEWRIDYLTDERIEELWKNKFPDKDLKQVAKQGVEWSDIGRLLALEAEGGVYVDSDVQDLVPIEQWPERYQHNMSDIDVILGVELPRPELGNPLQITNWAMAAKPGNSLIRGVLEKIVDEAHYLPDDNSHIIERTGPAAVTTAVLQAFRAHGLQLPAVSDFNGGQGHLFSLPEGNGGHNMEVLLLPYRAFGFNKDHMDDVVSDPYNQLLVMHKFAGSWKQGY